ncbi:hypothetical protein ACFQ68_11965 [Amycolatopsis japonica]|uniref:hypothetical protein n=1 Tax=Amycolatopsis japonica TaxID=208439 RepID=UPI00366B15AA
MTSVTQVEDTVPGRHATVSAWCSGDPAAVERHPETIRQAAAPAPPPTGPGPLPPSAKEHRTELIAELTTAPLVPACFVPGIEHQAAAAIVRAGLPTVEHQRRIDEHLFLDTAARTGVRVLARWDDRAHRVRIHVAEIGEPGLWDRIVAHFTRWDMAGRPGADKETRS